MGKIDEARSILRAQSLMNGGQQFPKVEAALCLPPRADSLDAAWQEADAALEEHADWWRIRSLVEVSFAPMRWEVVATDGNRVVRAEGHDPATALRALAAKLRESR